MTFFSSILGHVKEVHGMEEIINKSFFKQKMNNNMKSVVKRAKEARLRFNDEEN